MVYNRVQFFYLFRLFFDFLGAAPELPTVSSALHASRSILISKS